MTRLLLPGAGRDAVLADVRQYGRDGNETGAFLLSVFDISQPISVVALLGEAGIRRRPAHLVIDVAVIDQLFTFAEDRDLRVTAYLHSHMFGAFMSPTDKSGTIRSPGFIAGVIPDFRDPPSDPSEWGWWVHQQSQWQPAPPAAVDHSQPATVIAVDAHGVMDVGPPEDRR
jgi:hypothetical protein